MLPRLFFHYGRRNMTNISISCPIESDCSYSVSCFYNIWDKLICLSLLEDHPCNNSYNESHLYAQMSQHAFPITPGLWWTYKYRRFPCSFWLSAKKNSSNDHLERTCFHTYYKVCGLRESIKTSLHPFIFPGLGWSFLVVYFFFVVVLSLLLNPSIPSMSQRSGQVGS